MKNPFELFAEVEKETGITKVQLQGRQRDAAYVRARVLYSVMARKEGYTFPEIGGQLHKDHSTIVYHINKHTDRTNRDNLGIPVNNVANV